MLIIFTSPKGGTGKSTLTVLYANYLFQVFNKKVCIVDIDKNHSLPRKVKRHPDSASDERSYPVYASKMEDIPRLKQTLGKTFAAILVDLEYQLTEQFLNNLQAADLIVCPYRTDELTLEATLGFVLLLGLKKIKIATVFVPNRIKQQAEQRLIADIETVLQNYGKIAPAILDTQLFEKLNFFSNPAAVITYSTAALGFIKQHSIKSPA